MSKSKERCLILSACPVSGAMRRYCRPGDWVIACDAGYRNLAPLGLSADLLVGDFDSAPQPQEGQAIVLPHVKDDTDTQYAARWALEQGCREAVILGALGGQRLDHTMASLSTGLYLAKQGVQVLLADERTEVRYLLAGQSLELERGDWGYFSLFPLEGPAHGLTVKGAYYELEDSSLTPDFPLGVSNEFVSDKVFLSLREGSLGVFLVKAD
ncbi:thiamine diphosphokinase [Fournierella massiliensis]|nr:thiamine diphosphokinase [Fournierella massiliensis]MCF2556318.1 thiamine diphosphokinase [Fournierella massiliensis]